MNLKMKKRTVGLILIVLATTIVSVLAFYLDINPPIANVFGAYGAIAAVFIAGKLFKIEDGFYNLILLFIFFASPVGSVLNFYKSVGPYDKIVHYISGILLAAIGVMIVAHLLKKMMLNENQKEAAFRLILMFAFLTAGTGAGLWEIFEFVADKLVGGGMQRGMVDTLTDMIAGTLGGLTYVAVFGGYKKIKRKYKNGVDIG